MANQSKTHLGLLCARKRLNLKHSWVSNHWMNKDMWLDGSLQMKSGAREGGEMLSLLFKWLCNGAVSVSTYTFIPPCDMPAAFRKCVKKHHFSSRWRISVIFGYNMPQMPTVLGIHTIKQWKILSVVGFLPCSVKAWRSCSTCLLFQMLGSLEDKCAPCKRATETCHRQCCRISDNLSQNALSRTFWMQLGDFPQ